MVPLAYSANDMPIIVPELLKPIRESSHNCPVKPRKEVLDEKSLVPTSILGGLPSSILLMHGAQSHPLTESLLIPRPLTELKGVPSRYEYVRERNSSL